MPFSFLTSLLLAYDSDVMILRVESLTLGNWVPGDPAQCGAVLPAWDCFSGLLLGKKEGHFCLFCH